MKECGCIHSQKGVDDIKLVSIIVPIYGVEAYLSECVESLLTQTYADLEILLVDDSSPDDCPGICDRYAQQDPRVKVIHKPNGGAASARNAGLEVATGDYICFVDADDVPRKDYVQHLLTAAVETDADIAVCGYYDLTKKGSRIMPTQKPGLYTQVDYLKLFLTDWSCALLWNKIYRRDVIGSLRMAEGHKIDDEFFTYRIVMNSRKIVVTDIPLYDYRIRRSSVMHDAGVNGQRIMLDRIEYTAIRYKDVAQRYPELEPAFFAAAVDSMTRYWRGSYDMPKAKTRVRSWVNGHIKNLLKSQLSFKMRLVYLYHLYIKKPKGQPVTDVVQADLETCFD